MRKDGQPVTSARVYAVVMLHLQIRQEEVFCRKAFGSEYEEYCKRVRRYL